MERTVVARARFRGPWWLAMALVDVERADLFGPVLRRLPSLLSPDDDLGDTTLEFTPLVRTGTLGTMAVRWHGPGRGRGLPALRGEIRVREIDEHFTELALAVGGDLMGALLDDDQAGPRVQSVVEEAAEVVAERFAAAVARHIGTPPSS
jgi:hypothetical protein